MMKDHRDLSVMYTSLPPELEKKLKVCRRLPSPPSYALQVIELANDPEVNINQAVKVFSQDAVIVGKILRIANSPLYANHRKVETLEMAILLLGLNAATCLALSFSLVTSIKQAKKGPTLNYPLYWKRTSLAAAASRVLGKYCGIHNVEELFIASLLQDIGMLALDSVCPDLYAASSLNQQIHTSVVNHERQQLGVTHAMVGGWLLAQWHLPERLHLAVAYSEEPNSVSSTDEGATFVGCVAGAGILAQLLLGEATKDALQSVREQLTLWIGLPHQHLTTVLEEMIPIILEVDQLFDTNISQEVSSEELIEMAREGQLVQNLQVCREVEELKTGTTTLEYHYAQLENSAQRDGLTGVYNRMFLDEYLNKAFEQASKDSQPISLGFVDLDHFKIVNDTYGHAAGDQVLKAVAKLLQKQFRASDFIGRYGGEEFMVILPGTSTHAAQEVMNRMLESFRRTRHDVGDGQVITVTTSIGIVTHTPKSSFPDVQAWVSAADQALYAAKRNGRNQCCAYEHVPSSNSSQALC